MTDNEYSKARKAAVDALIYWARDRHERFTMRDAVNDYLEAVAVTALHRWRIDHPCAQKNAANRLAIDCIYNSFAIRLLTFPLFHRFIR